MRITICGTRGSTPAPGPDFVRYGGHTSCVAVSRDGGPPPLIVDAGTGLRRVTDLLGGAPFEGTILLSHLHWDHTHGIPFFRSGDHADARVELYLPEQVGDAESLLARGMSPPHFPIHPGQLRGSWRFQALNEGTHTLEGFEVLAREIPHKGGRTFGYRVSDGTASFAYLSDHHPIALGPGPTGYGEEHAAVRELADGVDLLIHDAQYTTEEFVERAHFGHSTFEYVLHLAETCRVKRILMFHHDPPRTDDELDAIGEALADNPIPVAISREGDVYELGPVPADG